MTAIGVADLKRPYYLLIDKTSFLPYQFVAKYVRGIDDRDFVSVTYRNIKTNPKSPSPQSWTYAAYAGKYQPFRPAEKIALVKAGSLIPEFTLPDYGPDRIDSISFSQYAGKVVLLDFWFKSCGPCMEAMPHYNNLQNKLGKERFQLLTINIEDGMDDIKFFYNKYLPAYKMLFNGGELFRSLGLTACPSSILVDQEGKVVRTFLGFDPEKIEKEIVAIIAAN
jgi:thiol-disulfide isomerase/thioredoxin